MKRYIIEMSNDFEKKRPKKAGEIIHIRNLYIMGLITETEAARGLLETITETGEEEE